MPFLSMACLSPTTNFSTVWKDETYQMRPEKILVINTFKNPANRRLFEDEFVETLKGRRLDAVVSYTVMPGPVVTDRDAIAVQAKATGADAVLINGPLETEQGEVYTSGGIEFGETYIHTRTEVYDMKSNRLIMSASAETWIKKEKPYADQIRSYIKDLVNMMSQQGSFRGGERCSLGEESY